MHKSFKTIIFITIIEKHVKYFDMFLMFAFISKIRER